MTRERSIRRYRRWYGRLLRLYSKPHYERFGAPMEQTFTDLLRERANEGRGLFGYALGMFIEASAGVIRGNATAVVAENKRRIVIVLATAFVLLLPLTAMQFKDDVVWSLTDFVVAGALLLGTGLTLEVAVRKAGTMAYRAAAGIAIAGALLLVWITLAVGIIGTEDNALNLMYIGVLAVGFIGALVARFQPDGMARALFATALAHATVAVIAVIAGHAYTVFLNGFFIGLWAGSALFFQNATSTEPESTR